VERSKAVDRQANVACSGTSIGRRVGTSFLDEVERLCCFV
jgi:hypothetical protein